MIEGQFSKKAVHDCFGVYSYGDKREKAGYREETSTSFKNYVQVYDAEKFSRGKQSLQK